MYDVDIGGPFDAVCYWDGFGIGDDQDQRRLLRRIAGWLAPDGRALDACEPGGAVDEASGAYEPRVPLKRAMAYLAVLRKA